MKMHKIYFPLNIGCFLLMTTLIFVPQVVHAQTNVCTDMSGMIIPCPDTSGSKPGPKNRPTAVIPSPISTAPQVSTSTSTSVPDSTATEIVIPITGGGAASNSFVPAVQNPGQSKSSFPGPLGLIIAVLIIIVCFGGSLVFLRSFRKAGETNAGFGDGSVRTADPGNKFIKLEDPSNQFQKADDATKQFEKTKDGNSVTRNQFKL